jgi:hypothetical protein
LTGLVAIVVAPTTTTLSAPTTTSAATTELFATTTSAATKLLAAAETTAAAARLVGLRLGFVHSQGAPVELESVHRGDSLLGFTCISHFDETKASRASGFTIGDDADLLNCAVGLKGSA